MSKLNLTNIKVFKVTFENEKRNFNTQTNPTFYNGYISTCSDYIVQRMESVLANKYSRIKEAYQKIENWWDSYVENLEGLENALSNNGRTGSISESLLRNYVESQLQELPDYFPDLTKLQFKESSNFDFDINSIEDIRKNYNESIGYNTNGGKNAYSFLLDINSSYDKTGATESNKSESMWTSISNWWKEQAAKVSDFFKNIGKNDSKSKNDKTKSIEVVGNKRRGIETIDFSIFTEEYVADIDNRDQVYNCENIILNSQIEDYQKQLNTLQIVLNHYEEEYSYAQSQYTHMRDELANTYNFAINLAYSSPQEAETYLKQFGLTNKTLINIDDLNKELSKYISKQKAAEIVYSYSSLGDLQSKLTRLGVDESIINSIIEKSIFSYQEAFDYYTDNSQQFKEFNNYIRELTGFNSYDDLSAYYLKTQSECMDISANIYQLEQQEKMLKYTVYTVTDAYQSFNDSNYTIDDYNLDKSKFFGKYDYDEYISKCSDENKISPLQYVEYVLSKDPNAKFEINGYDDEKLKVLLSMSKTQTDADSINVEKLFNFIYYNNNAEDGKELIEALENEINKHEGELRAKEFLDKLAEEDGNLTWDDVLNQIKMAGKGTSDGVEQWANGIYYSIEQFKGEDSSKVYSADEYETMFILQAIASRADRKEQGLITVDKQGNIVSSSSVIDYTKDYTAGLSFNYQLNQSTGNMLPSVVISAAAANLLGPISITLGSTTIPVNLGSIAMGVSASGNSYHNARVNGASDGQAILYGLASGLSEASFQYLMGGIPGLSKADDAVRISNGYSSALEKMASKAVQGLSSVGSEMIEEPLQTFNDAALRKYILGDNINWTDVGIDAMKSGAMAFFSSGYFNMAHAGFNYVNTHQTNGFISNNNISYALLLANLADQNIMIDSYLASNPNMSPDVLFNNLLYNNPEIINGMVKGLKTQDLSGLKVDEGYKLSNRNWDNDFIQELAKDYDDLGFISKETGQQLEEIFFNEDNLIGIHRCGMMPGNNIIEDGLLLTGHMGTNKASLDNVDLGLNISFYDKTDMDYLLFIKALKDGGGYKTLSGVGDVIIVSIPKSELATADVINGNIKFKNPSSAINTDGVSNKLSSKYLYGFVTSSPDSISDIKTKSTNVPTTPDNFDTHITLANNYTAQGKTYTINTNSLENIPIDFWSRVNNPNNVTIQVGNDKYSYKDLCDISQQDIAGLYETAGVSDFHKKMDMKELNNLLHEIFDNTHGYEKIQTVLDEINIVDENNWKQFCKEQGLSEFIVGFVDKDSQLYLPSNASVHTAVHEAFHKVSELSYSKIPDSEGNLRKVTGIREFYNDGFNSTWANETLTDYLASKYSDGKIYDTMYGKENIYLWNRIDEALVQLNLGHDLLANSYFNNNTNPIREIFDKYCTKGTYDDFARYLSTSYKDYKILDSMVSSIETNIYKSQHPIMGTLKSIFGGK